MSLGSLLGYLDNAHTAQTPRGLPQLLEELIGALQPGASVLVWPQAEYNYSILDVLPSLRKALENVLSEGALTDAFKDFIGPLNLISFPRIERDNILVHPVLGHELGHPIADEFLFEEKSSNAYGAGLLNAHQKLLERLGISSGADVSTSITPEQQVSLANDLRLVLNIRTRGIQELLSDCVAALIFGPSALFASHDIFAITPLDSLPQSPSLYPPHRMRLRLLRNVLRDAGALNHLRQLDKHDADTEVVRSVDAFLNYLDTTVDQTGDQDALGGNTHVSIAYEWITQSMSNALEFARKKVGTTTYSSDKILKELPEAIERLKVHVPPNEIGAYPNMTPIDWRSAILAGWLVTLHVRRSTSETASTIKSIENTQRIQKLTFCAVEYAIIQKNYAARVTARLGESK